jgi:hypothetical protein
MDENVEKDLVVPSFILDKNFDFCKNEYFKKIVDLSCVNDIINNVILTEKVFFYLN